uniref:Ribonuclease VapC n=1 Tax=Chlorobium chlorochromatii (strain CaD3) TaxID=340177 RepID=Q3AQN5_CHLCH
MGMQNNRYMLDTNIASHIIKGDIPVVRERLIALPMEAIMVSSVTKGELMYGLAKRDYPKVLTQKVNEFLLRIQVLAWDQDVAVVYGKFRSACETIGVTLSPLDLMIAAHAHASNAILVTADKAFSRVPNLVIENWASEPS